MSFRTRAGIIQAEVSGKEVKVRMTSPHSLQMDIRVEVDGKICEGHFINTGVPHLVCLIDSEAELEAMDVALCGRALRFHPRFQPAGTNVNFVWVQDAHSLSLRTYERGVEGETLACGTGAMASALIAAARKRVASPVKAQTRGGEILTIYFDKQPAGAQGEAVRFGEVYLEGEARVAYEADLWDETL